MSESLIEKEIFEYNKGEPFVVLDIMSTQESKKNILNHWHDELEIVYIVKDSSMHYIDGKCYQSKEGSVLLTNSNSIHSIVPSNDEIVEGDLLAIVLLIHDEFLKEFIPEFENIYFLNEDINNREEIKKIIIELYTYSRSVNKTKNGNLYAKSLLLKLLYFLLEEGTMERSLVMPIQVEKDIYRIKGVIQYIEKNYNNKLVQEEIAKKFYFSREHFSKYFKKCTGTTFTEYLTKYRLKHATDELLKTDKTISEIALNNGFSDDRRFIIAFKKYYNTTPLQYRKTKNVNIFG